MNWYFAITEESLCRPGTSFSEQSIVAVASARLNTNLRPFLVYDGAPNEHTAVFQRMGVTVLHHSFSLAKRMAERAHAHYPMHVAHGAFLRLDVPELAKGEEYVLYTDCDVLFLPNFSLHGAGPQYFAIAPEFDITNFEKFNSGVMLMNVEAMRYTLPLFKNFVLENFLSFDTYDQTAFQIFFRGETAHLSPLSNWKPYWGVNPEAELIHFHGPKPPMLIERLKPDAGPLIPELEPVFQINPEGFKHYTAKWQETREEARRVWGV